LKRGRGDRAALRIGEFREAIDRLNAWGCAITRIICGLPSPDLRRPV
jgi:hypothetical protein